MSITLDAVTGVGSQGTGSSTYTFAHTCTGANVALLVLASNSGNGQTITGVTYNGNALTNLHSQNILISGNTIKLYMWGIHIPAPDGSAHNVVITASNSSFTTTGGAISLANVLSTPFPDKIGDVTVGSIALTPAVSNSAAIVFAISNGDGSNNLTSVFGTQMQGTASKTFGMATSSPLVISGTSAYTMEVGNNSSNWMDIAAIFEPAPIVYPLTAATGTYTYTGFTATLGRVVTMIASAGAYVLTGRAATLLYRMFPWVSQTKNTASFTSETKHTGNFTPENKN